MSNLEKVYADTNILVSYALGTKDKRFDIVKRFFDHVASGKYRLLISNFVLEETLHALRSIATRGLYKELRNNLTQRELINIANSNDFRKEIRKRSWKAYRDIIDMVTSDQEHFQVGTSATDYPSEIFSNGLNIIAQTFGELRVYRYRCTKCESYMDCNVCGVDSEIVYKAPNAPDLTHIFIAATLGCTCFFTMDKYFRLIPEGEMPLKVEILG